MFSEYFKLLSIYACLAYLISCSGNSAIRASYEEHSKACENALETGIKSAALSSCQQAYNDTQQGKFSDKVKSAALYNISTANRNAEKLDQAVVYLEQSIVLEEKYEESGSLELSRRLSSLATIYAQLGDFNKAIPVVLRLIPIIEKNYTNEWQWLPIMLDDFVTEAINLKQEENARLIQEASNRLKPK